MNECNQVNVQSFTDPLRAMLLKNIILHSQFEVVPNVSELS